MKEWSQFHNYPYSIIQFQYFPNYISIPPYHSFPFSSEVSLSWRLLSGLVSGSISALLANPADVVLIRMQADGAWPLAHRRGYRHALHGLWSVWRGEGWQALYRGSGPTALRAALVTMAQLPTYEELKGDSAYCC